MMFIRKLVCLFTGHVWVEHGQYHTFRLFTCGRCSDERMLWKRID